MKHITYISIIIMQFIFSFNINDLYSDNWNQLSEYLSDKQISLIKDYIRVNGEINNIYELYNID